MTIRNWFRWVRYCLSFLCLVSLTGCYLYAAEPVDGPDDDTEAVKLPEPKLGHACSTLWSAPLSTGCHAVDPTRPKGMSLACFKPLPGCIAEPSIGAWCCP